MTQIKSNLFSFLLGCIIALVAFIKFGPKPEPEIKVVEKIVEVEKKQTVKKTKLDIFPDGSMSFEEDEITDYLKKIEAARKAEIIPPAPPRHHFNVIFSAKVTGGEYRYQLKNLNAGVIVNNGLYGTVGVGF